MATTEKFAFQMSEAPGVSGISRTSLYGAIKDGRLKSIVVNGRRLILADDMRAFLESHRTDDTPTTA